MAESTMKNINKKANFRQAAPLQRYHLNWELKGKNKPATERAGKNAV